MIRNTINVTVTLTALLLPVLTGCVGRHRSDPAPMPLAADAPSLLTPPPAPVSLIATETDVPVPDLPAPPQPSAQPAPPPSSALADTSHKPARNGRHRGRKGEQELAERDARERELREKEGDKAPETTASQVAAPQTAQNQNTNKVTAPTPSGDLAQTTSIGQLAAGSTQDATGSRQQATSLIDATQRGVNSLRNLNYDQSKTVVQIRSFLDQAERALQHGDIDGASTLATKAKTLLDELTGAS